MSADYEELLVDCVANLSISMLASYALVSIWAPYAIISINYWSRWSTLSEGLPELHFTPQDEANRVNFFDGCIDRLWNRAPRRYKIFETIALELVYDIGGLGGQDFDRSVCDIPEVDQY